MPVFRYSPCEPKSVFLFDSVLPQRKLMDLGKQPNVLGKDANGCDLDLTKLVDGAVPSSLMAHVQHIYRAVAGIASWSDW